MTVMLYHEPDNRWPVFGCKDYDTYLEKHLIKGAFHSAVPEDIKKSYETAEYTMAHAWYHYPLYDEALNKLLRIFEMAVKQKCELLSISTKNKKKDGTEVRRTLNELIKDVCIREPGKKQSVFLNHLRDLRNISMHPDRHTFLGNVYYNKIQLTVNILNILFAPESFILRLYSANENFRNKLNPFLRKALVFAKGDKVILVHGLNFIDVFLDKQEEVILIYLEPVCVLKQEEREKKAMPELIPVEIKNPVITTDKIKGIDTKSGLNIILAPADHPRDIAAADEFRSYVEGLKEGTISTYITAKMHEVGKAVQKFHYDYYQLIN